MLSCILTKAETDGCIHSIKVSRISPPISHLMYADDLVVYCRATKEEATEILKCLDTFTTWSGQEVKNKAKSSINFSCNTPMATRVEILRILQMSECSHNSSYLGLPFCKTQPKAATFSHLLDRINRKLTAWKLKTLSFVGRGILIKTVAQPVPVYTMQTYLPESDMW